MPTRKTDPTTPLHDALTPSEQRACNLFPGDPFLREEIRQACERHQTVNGLILRLEKHLSRRDCSLSLPPVLFCLSDLCQFTELHRASREYVRKWKKSVERSYARDARPLTQTKLQMAQLQRKKRSDPEKKAQSLAKLRAEAQVTGRPKKVKPGDTIRMADPVTSYYADIEANVRQSRIRSLLTVELSGRVLLHATTRQGVTHILAACIKGLVDHGFTAYKSGKTIIELLLRIFYPEYANKGRQNAALETYRNRYVRGKM